MKNKQKINNMVHKPSVPHPDGGMRECFTYGDKVAFIAMFLIVFLVFIFTLAILSIFLQIKTLLIILAGVSGFVTFLILNTFFTNVEIVFYIQYFLFKRVYFYKNGERINQKSLLVREKRTRMAVKETQKLFNRIIF